MTVATMKIHRIFLTSFPNVLLLFRSFSRSVGRSFVRSFIYSVCSFVYPIAIPLSAETLGLFLFLCVLFAFIHDDNIVSPLLLHWSRLL